jgi:hypothetical protein
MVSSFSLWKSFGLFTGPSPRSFAQIQPEEFRSLLHPEHFVAGATEHDRQVSDSLRTDAEHFENLSLVHLRELAFGLENAPGIAPSTHIENFVYSGFSAQAVVSSSDVASRVASEKGKKNAIGAWCANCIQYFEI